MQAQHCLGAGFCYIVHNMKKKKEGTKVMKVAMKVKKPCIMRGVCLGSKQNDACVYAVFQLVSASRFLLLHIAGLCCWFLMLHSRFLLVFV